MPKQYEAIRDKLIKKGDSLKRAKTRPRESTTVNTIPLQSVVTVTANQEVDNDD